MPIPIRRFNLKKLIEKRDRENEAIEKAKNKGTSISMQDMVNKKPIAPDYVTKASTKK